MIVTRRVPSPRSLRHLLQVASVSASVVGKRVLHVKHGRSASSRACQTRRELAVCSAVWNLQHVLRSRIPQGIPFETALGLCWGRRPESISVEFAEGIGLVHAELAQIWEFVAIFPDTPSGWTAVASTSARSDPSGQ